MPAGPHPADSLNHFQPDLGIPYDSISSGSALALGYTPIMCSQHQSSNRKYLSFLEYFFIREMSEIS
jgi:hypothetical protein